MRSFAFLICSLSINIGWVAAEHITISPSCGASSCVTLAQYTPSTSDNITLSLLPGDHVVSSTVMFEQKEYVALQGYDPSAPRPVIRCTGQDVNLEFVRINMFHFQYAIIVNCVVVVKCRLYANQVSISYLMATANDQPILKITSCAYVNVSYSAFQGHYNTSSGMQLRVNTGGNLKITYCNFTDFIIAGSQSSLIEFNNIAEVQLLHCNLRNITVGRYGSVVELRNAHNVHIESSIFDGNFLDISGSLVDMRYVRTALISCSTFLNNVLINGHGSLIRGSRSLVVTNSTFAHNKLSRIVEQATSCSVISSVFEYNVGTQYSVFFPNSRGFLLASNFAHNNISRIGSQVDCTYFVNNSIPRFVSNSSTCNQLLLAGTRGACQRDSCSVCSLPRATIGLEFVEYTWRENEYHSLQVCTVATEIAFPIMAEFHIKNGTASENEDFASMEACCGHVEFSLKIGRQKYCINIWVFSDNKVEGNEQFTVELTTEHPLVSVQNSMATVTIMDDVGTGTSLTVHTCNITTDSTTGDDVMSPTTTPSMDTPSINGMADGMGTSTDYSAACSTGNVMTPTTTPSMDTPSINGMADGMRTSTDCSAACSTAGTHPSEVTPPNLWIILTPVAAIICLLTWICGALCGAAMFHCRTKPKDINISQQPGPEEEQTDCMKIQDPVYEEVEMFRKDISVQNNEAYGHVTIM